MTTIGWEFYGVKFSMLITMLASVAMFLGVWLGTRERGHFPRIDTMAGDEGEE
jgi:hypothetical protein